MPRLSKRRRKELEDYWELGHLSPRFVIYEVDGKEFIFSEYGGLAVGVVNRSRSEAA